MKHTSLLAVWIFLLSAAFDAVGAPLRHYPQRLVQPDGTIVHCYASGDEFNHWLHDKDNYTIVQHPTTGYFVYAVLENGKLIASGHVVGKVDPATVGLKRGVNISADEMERRREILLQKAGGVLANPSTMGSINNIVLFIRFADESRDVFPDSIGLYDRAFNASSPGANSMYNYFTEASYGQFATTATFYPVTTDSVISYQDVNTRNYYRKYNAVTNPIGYSTDNEGISREQVLVKNAVQSLGSQIPQSLNIDANGDGYVDNISIIYSGNAEWEPWALWPHSWNLNTPYPVINGKAARRYTVTLRQVMIDNQIAVAVLCHEMFHALGAPRLNPDMYHYNNLNDEALGRWDLMDYGKGHMSAYVKHRYANWIASIPTISTPGTYTLAPLTSPANNCYAIPSPFSAAWPSAPSREYFVLEYRKRIGPFEGSLPGEGLLVYRVNSGLDGQGNYNGPPDELYLYRPGGTTYATADSAAFSSNSGRVSLTDSTNPRCFLSDGSAGGLNISNVGIAGDSITFTLKASLPAVMAVMPPSVTFGFLNTSVTSRDTVLLISNRGLTRDSVRVTIDSGNVTPSLAIRVRPTEFDLPGEATRACTVSVSPKTLQESIMYTAKIIIDGTPGPGQKHFEIPVAFGVVTGVKAMAEVPKQFGLDQNYPNPFNPSTSIKYELPKSTELKLSVFDLLGREVSVLVNERRDAGVHEVKFDASNLASGVYFYRLQAGDFVQTRKLLLLR
jgi:M6 family metalloprotease-like protein